MSQQIKAAIFTVIEQTDTTLGGTLHRYLNCISPFFHLDGDGRFPVSLNRHTIHLNASAVGGFNPILCFHIGDAILSYYILCQIDQAQRQQGQSEEKEVESQTRRAFERIRYLEELAANYAALVVSGNEQHGFMLLTPEAAKGLEKVHRAKVSRD